MLNAFRHQRIERVSQPRRLQVTIYVLNAFRHQRIERFRANQRLLHRVVVLNAFRHQRIERQIPPTGNDAEVTCSTPFGINGLNAR